MPRLRAAYLMASAYAANGKRDEAKDILNKVVDQYKRRYDDLAQAAFDADELRHDPDKIMVGEIRDVETAQIAVQSALTGHLVFTTVHANNVVDVLGRFLNMKVEPYNFVSALNCVVAQRLVRVICDKCRLLYEIVDEIPVMLIDKAQKLD